MRMKRVIKDLDISDHKAKRLYVEIEEGLPVTVSVTRQPNNVVWVTVTRNPVDGVIEDRGRP
jgi:hypothetical protein